MTIAGFYSCNQKGEKNIEEGYYFDIYTPNDLENKSGTSTDKKPIDFKRFEKEFGEIDWGGNTASPTIYVYNGNTILWVALYATSENVEKLQMFIIGYQYKKELNVGGEKKEKDFSTTHLTVGQDKVLSLFKLYFENNYTENIINQLKRLDEQIKQGIGQFKAANPF